MTRSSRIIWTGAVALVFSAQGARADFPAGLAVYNTGDHQTALAECVPLAQAGNSGAVLSPVTTNGRETLAVDLHRHLAGILSLAAQTKNPPEGRGHRK